MPLRLKKIASYALAAGLIVFLLIKGLVPAWREVHSDFANYYVSSKLITDGQPLDSLYNNNWFQRKIDEQGISTYGKFAPFPPATAWVMIPITPFSPLTAQRIFTVFNLLFLIPGIFLLRRLTGWSTLACSMLILGAGLGLANNIAFGQLYWLMSVAMLYALILERDGYPVVAGVILAVFTAVKYFPIVLIVGYVLAGILAVHNEKAFGNSRQRLVISFSIALLVLIMLQYLFFGRSLMTEYVHAAFLPHLDGRLNGQVIYSLGFQSWNGFLRNLFVADPQYNPHPFIDWPAGRPLVQLIILAGVFAGMLAVLLRHRFVDPKIRQALSLSLPAISFMVILPASATYHFILLLIPLGVIIGADVLQRRTVMAVISVYCVIGFLPYSIAFHLASEWGLFFGFPRLWAVCLIYLIVILSVRKQKFAHS